MMGIKIPVCCHIPMFVVTVSILVTVTRCGRGGGLSPTDPPLLRSGHSVPGPARPPALHSPFIPAQPLVNFRCTVYCTVYSVHALRCSIQFSHGSRSDLSAAHASNYDNNKCTLFMGNYRNDGPHSCCHTFPGTTCLYLPVQG